MKKIKLTKILLATATVFSCQSNKNENCVKDIDNGLQEWYKQINSKTKISDLNDLHCKFTGGSNEFLSAFGDTSFADLKPYREKSQEKLISFFECFYEKSVSCAERSNFSLEKSNEVYLLHMFSPLTLDKTTGTGRFDTNSSHGRVYEERKYQETICKWNEAGVIPKIFLWSQDDIHKVTKDKDCKFQLFSIKAILKELEETKMFDATYLSSLSEKIEEVIKDTNDLTGKPDNEADTIRKKINYQMRYGIVNLLRVIVMHHLAIDKSNSGKILTYADWVLTPTKNLGELPGENLLYGAEVHTGLMKDCGNGIENTAFFYKNINDGNIFLSEKTKTLYEKALDFVKCLLICKETVFEGDDDPRLKDLNPNMKHCLRNPQYFTNNDSYVYGLFLDLINELSHDHIKKIMIDYSEKNFPEEYYTAKKLIEENLSTTTLETLTYKSSQVAGFEKLYDEFDTNNSEKYKIFCTEQENKLREFREKNFDKAMCEDREKSENQYPQAPISYEGKEEYENYKEKLREEAKTFRRNRNMHRLSFLREIIKNYEMENLHKEYMSKQREELLSSIELSIPVNITRRSGHA